MTDEELAICNKGLQSTANYYGRLVAKDREGKVVDSGTATFLELDGKKIIATAGHVHSGLSPEGSTHLLVFQDFALEKEEKASVPIDLPLDFSDSLPLCDEPPLDMAVLRPPPELLSSTHIGWFEADTQVDVVRQIRDESVIGGDARFGAFVVGFPHFARLEFDTLKVQVAGAFAVWAYIERFIDLPEILGKAKAPQIILQVEAPKHQDLPGAGSVVRSFIDNIPRLCELGQEALGGYSGAPLMYFCAGGNFLLGLVKEGQLQLGGRAYATAIDHFVSAVRASPKWSAW